MDLSWKWYSMPHMKKVKSANRSSTAKRNSAPRNVDEYVARVQEPARAVLNKMRATIQAVTPLEATETISYRIPAFKTDKGVLLWFAAFSDHISLFPTASVIEAFQDELKSFSTSKGTIHFPMDRPLPIALIKKIVKARVAQLGTKKKRRIGRS